MVAIEKTFNTIWKAPPRPRGVSRFLLYWSILSLGPLLLGLAFVVSSYVTSLPFIAGAAETLGGPAKLLPYLPFILSSLAFIAIYAIIPNTHVPLGYACLGGLFSALLFELAKLIFTLFLRYFPTYELVYGAFAAAPLFLIWVYLCWLIILLGAEWVYALTNYRYRQRQDKWPDFITALAVVHYCYQQQQRGRAVTVNAISRQYYPLNQNQWQVIRRVLLRARIIVQVEQGRYLLARDLAHFSLHEFMRLFPWRWPSRFNQQDLPWLVTIGHVVTAINEAAKDHTSISLAELFTNKAIADANPNN
jgi:membrane protein